MEEEVVLCAASAYEQKFYLNPQFESLPEAGMYFNNIIIFNKVCPYFIFAFFY